MMMSNRFVSRLLCAAAGLAFSAGGAMAQAAASAPAAPARPAAPEVKMVGDWAVRCFPINSPSPCDMYQELADKDTRQRVLAISVAYVPSLDRNGIIISVPLEVSIPKGLVIQTDNFTSPALKYRRCDRNGCYVEMPMDAASIASLSKSGPNANIKISADGGKEFSLKFSLNGFASGYDQMVQLAKEKAKPLPKQDGAAPQQ
jgi:invasion protein IalB